MNRMDRAEALVMVGQVRDLVGDSKNLRRAARLRLRSSRSIALYCDLMSAELARVSEVMASKGASDLAAKFAALAREGSGLAAEADPA